MGARTSDVVLGDGHVAHQSGFRGLHGDAAVRHTLDPVAANRQALDVVDEYSIGPRVSGAKQVVGDNHVAVGVVAYADGRMVVSLDSIRGNHRIAAVADGDADGDGIRRIVA